MAQAPTTTGYIDPRPRWRRRILRAVAGGLTLLVIGYLALPWWLPTGWIGRRLCNQLTDGLGRPASVGAVTLSWSEGVTFTDLVIDSSPGQPFPHFVRVGRLRCGFTPLTTLLTGRVNRIELIEPALWLSFDEQGKVTSLQKMGESEKLPAYEFVLIRPACHLVTPETSQEFALEKLTCHIKPDEGLVTIHGGTDQGKANSEPAPDHFEFQSRLTVPQLRKDVPFHGEIRIAWKNLALAELPAPLVNELPIARMDGRTSGKLAIEIPASMQLAYKLDIGLDRVSIAFQKDDQPGRIPDARLACQGQFDPATEELIVRDFEFETPGLRVARPRGLPGPTMLIDQIGVEPFALHVGGSVKDFAILQREFPALASALTALGIDLQGSAAFAFSIQPSGTEDRVTFRLNGEEATWHVAGKGGTILQADRGVPKSLGFDLTRERATDQVALRLLDIRIADMHAEVRSDVSWDAENLKREAIVIPWTTIYASETSLALHVENLQNVGHVFPVLGQALSCEDWKGLLSLRAALDPIPAGASRGPGTNLTVTLDGGSETELRIHDFWVKPQGVPLSARLRAAWPREAADHLHTLEFHLTQGDFVAELVSDQTPVEWRLTAAEEPDDLSRVLNGHAAWSLPGRIEHIERLRAWSPRLRKLLDGNGHTVALTGDLSFTGRGSATSEASTRTLWQQLALDAAELAVDIEDVMNKPQGEPLTLSAELHRLVFPDGWELSLETRLTHPSADAAGRYTRSSTGDSGEGTQATALDLDVHDAAALLEFVPLAGRYFADYDPRGAARVRLGTLTTDGRQDVHLVVDADDAGWQVSGERDLVKPPGMTASAELRWSMTQLQPDIYTFRLVDGHVALDESRLHEMSGELSVQLPSAGSSEDTSVTDTASVPIGSKWLAGRIPSGQIDFIATSAFTDKLRTLNPELGRELGRLGLSGRAETKVQLQFDPQRLTLAWDTDASGLGWDIPIDAPWLERELKAPGAPLLLAGGLSATGWRDGDMTVTFEDVDLNMRGAQFGSTGQWTLHRGADGNLRQDTAEVAFALDIANLEQWLAHHPGVVDRAAGALQAAGQLHWEDGRWHADSGSLICNDVRLARGDNDVALNGEMLWDERRVGVQQMAWGWGASSGVVSAEIQRAPLADQPSYVGLAIRNLDIPDAQRQWKRLQGDLLAVSSSAPASPSPGGPLVDGRPPWVMPFLTHAREHDYRIDAHVDTLAVVLPPEVPTALEAVTANVRLIDGHCDLTFSALADGGNVGGRMVTELSVDDPQYHLTYTANGVEPGPLVNTYLQRTFPGMTAGGPLTLIDETYQKLFPRFDEPNAEVGQGELVIEGGTVEGRAAPEWMTRIFPNLNLTRFKFDYMHSWFDKMPSGRVVHRMIYQGNYYNIFMDGHTDPDQRMRYQVGIDLLADFDSRYWVDTGQGRIPLFVKTGIIQPDGTLADERITYEPARRILNTIFISNNPVITAYHAARKLALRKE